MLLQQADTLRELSKEAEGTLKGYGCEEPKADTEALLSWVLGCSRGELYLRADETLDPKTCDYIRRLLEIRGKGRYPLAYIMGLANFMDFRLAVNEDVLIPRPETEFLVEKVLDFADASRQITIADIGTGSGAIAIALASYLPLSEVIATELSPKALAVAQENIKRYGLERRITCLEGDLLGAVTARTEPVFDIIVANLPYVSTADMAILSPEVKKEPAAALEAGSDGLDLYRRFLPQAWEHLRYGGQLFIEIGYNQGGNAVKLVREAGFESPILHKDYGGIDRIVSGNKCLK